ncbi:MAG: hypothetical protein V4694_05395 [Pseudomonadota bacterium]
MSLNAAQSELLSAKIQKWFGNVEEIEGSNARKLLAALILIAEMAKDPNRNISEAEEYGLKKWGNFALVNQVVEILRSDNPQDELGLTALNVAGEERVTKEDVGNSIINVIKADVALLRKKRIPENPNRFKDLYECRYLSEKRGLSYNDLCDLDDQNPEIFRPSSFLHDPRVKALIGDCKAPIDEVHALYDEKDQKQLNAIYKAQYLLKDHGFSLEEVIVMRNNNPKFDKIFQSSDVQNFIKDFKPPIEEVPALYENSEKFEAISQSRYLIGYSYKDISDLYEKDSEKFKAISQSQYLIKYYGSYEQVSDFYDNNPEKFAAFSHSKVQDLITSGKTSYDDMSDFYDNNPKSFTHSLNYDLEKLETIFKFRYLIKDSSESSSDFYEKENSYESRYLILESKMSLDDLSDFYEHDPNLAVFSDERVKILIQDYEATIAAMCYLFENDQKKLNAIYESRCLLEEECFLGGRIVDSLEDLVTWYDKDPEQLENASNQVKERWNKKENFVNKMRNKVRSSTAAVEVTQLKNTDRERG